MITQQATEQEWICIKCGKEVAKLAEVCPFCQTAVDPLLGKILAGKYRLIQKLAEGGMGYVYLAEHIRLKTKNKRAIKILKQEIMRDALVQKRFLREVELTNHLGQSNPHIVAIHDDYGFEDGIGYYVMEFLEGKSLKNYIEQLSGQLPLLWIIDIMTQICDALNTVHQADIIHRDLKPDNIFLIKDSRGEDFVKLIDFGVSKAENIGTQYTQSGSLVGTLSYLAPEQINNTMVEKLDARCDIYALGCIFWEMITGQPPFDLPESMISSQFFQYLMQRMTVQPVPPSTKRADLPPVIDQIVMKMLAKMPDERYQNILELTEELQKIQRELGHNPDLLEQLNVLHKFNFSDVVQINHSFANSEERLQVLPLSTPRNESSQILAGANIPVVQVPQIIAESDIKIIAKTSRKWPTTLGLAFIAIITALSIGWLIIKPTKHPTHHKQAVAVAPKERKANIKSAHHIKHPQQADIHKHHIKAKDAIRERPQPPVIRPVIAKEPLVVKNDHNVRDAGSVVSVRKPSVRVSQHKKHIKKAKTTSHQSENSWVAVSVSVAGCPADQPNSRWIRLNVYPRSASFQLILVKGKGVIQRISSGFCLAQQSSSQIQLNAAGYQPCIITLPFKTDTLTLQMKREAIDDISVDQNYCLQRR
jgi:serine/threonine protein kinase